MYFTIERKYNEIFTCILQLKENIMKVNFNYNESNFYYLNKFIYLF